jgi:dTDP-4-dehydrorhamnose 3,5-epimerase-like enzyme
MTGENGQMLRIPEGLDHAFLALFRFVGFTSRFTHFYSAPGERTHAWNNLGLSIPWPIRNSEAIVPEKNSGGLRIADAEVFA